jgi:hypothetical protein
VTKRVLPLPDLTGINGHNFNGSGRTSMAKFYVECGDLRVVVQAANPIPAAAKALSWATEDDRLGDLVTISERGYPGDRRGGQLYDADIVVETGTLISLITEHDLF